MDFLQPYLLLNHLKLGGKFFYANIFVWTSSFYSLSVVFEVERDIMSVDIILDQTNIIRGIKQSIFA